MTRLSKLIVGACLLAALMPSAWGSCEPPRLIATTYLQSLPGYSIKFIPVRLAGVPKLMLLDTGAATTVMGSGVKEELGLKGHKASGRVYAVTGAYSEQYVTAPLEFARLTNPKVRFMVWPGSFFEEKDAHGRLLVAGLLGADILGQFDLSIDFARSRLDLMDPDHCKGKVVYWDADVVAEVPFKRLRSGHVVLPVKIDGREVSAILDTGATTSTLEKDRAQRDFGLVLGSSDTPEAGLLHNTPGMTIWTHKFATLSFGDVVVTNPEMTVIPDPVSSQTRVNAGGGRITKDDDQSEPDVLIGMDVLARLHLYISYKEKMLYITPAWRTQPTPAQ